MARVQAGAPRKPQGRGADRGAGASGPSPATRGEPRPTSKGADANERVTRPRPQMRESKTAGSSSSTRKTPFQTGPTIVNFVERGKSPCVFEISAPAVTSTVFRAAGARRRAGPNYQHALRNGPRYFKATLTQQEIGRGKVSTSAARDALTMWCDPLDQAQTHFPPRRRTSRPLAAPPPQSAPSSSHLPVPTLRTGRGAAETLRVRLLPRVWCFQGSPVLSAFVHFYG